MNGTAADNSDPIDVGDDRERDGERDDHVARIRCGGHGAGVYRACGPRKMLGFRLRSEVCMKAFWCARTGVASALLLIGLAGGIVASQRTASSMTTAANKFLEGLTPEQRQQAVLPLDSEDLTRWHYVPTNQFPRKGLPIKDMTEAQRKLAHDLLRTGLSQQGYTTATAIMNIETVLRAIESAAKPGAGMNRDPELSFFTVFGTPSAKGPWGWRVNGHHLSVHFMVGDTSKVASSPTFFGTDPAAELREGPKKGLRIQAAEQDAGRALVSALDEPQRKTAIIGDIAPNDIVRTEPCARSGIRCRRWA